MSIIDFEREEFVRQDTTLNFIASENLPSEEILKANSSILMAKYAEGFPNARYYQGVNVADKVELECMKECLKTFNATEDYYANVQMSSGCQANITTYHALLEEGDVILSPDTASLGHISHGIKGSFLDRYYTVVHYGLDENGYIDYQQVEELADKYKPTLIICGASNYSQPIDFSRFRKIADASESYLMADISHIAGLVVAGAHMSPVGYADIITSTLHKTLRGVRGAIILYKKELDKRIKYATIPGLWGGSHLNNTLAKLQTFKEAQTPAFKNYINQVLANTKIMADTFIECDIPIVSGGTTNHVFCLDLTDFPINGKDLAQTLELCGVITNANAIPNDTSFIKPHGLRIGCASVTTRGLKEDECKAIARCIALYLQALRAKDDIQASNSFAILQGIVRDCVSFHPLKNLYPRKYEELFQESYILN